MQCHRTLYRVGPYLLLLRELRRERKGLARVKKTIISVMIKLLMFKDGEIWCLLVKVPVKPHGLFPAIGWEYVFWLEDAVELL